MFINMEILANRNINIITNSIWSGPGGKKSFDPKKIVTKFTWKILEFVLFSVNFQSINYFFLNLGVNPFFGKFSAIRQ